MHRCWLLHWSLFVYFPQGGDGVARFIDLAMSEMYTNAIQTQSAHLLRYLTVAIVVSNQRRYPLKELVRIIEMELLEDPITKFMHCLYLEYDFEAAQLQLNKAVESMKKDYFLKDLAPQFMENARLLLFRSFCKIHQCLDMGMLSKKLGMTPANSESWIVNLIRNEQDAKIDSAKNQIVFNQEATPIYQKIIEKTQALSTQTALLQANIQKARKL